jgi:hypothetical protein
VPDTLEMTIHGALLVAVQSQLPAVDSVAVKLPPAAGAFHVAGETVYAQGVPAWVTVNVWPATVSVPVRDAVDVLAATTKPTTPFPLPDAPLPIVIQETLLVAVQAQPLADVTDTVALSPAAGEFQLAGAIENVQGAPAWVTVKV